MDEEQTTECAGQQGSIPRIIWKPGSRILDEYVVRRIIGSGGVGTIYLVSPEENPDIEYAVKTLRYDSKGGSNSMDSLLSELQVWIDLPPHPNIVTCRFFRTVMGNPVIFSEYIDGGDLRWLLKSGKKLNLDTILDVSIQVAEGLRVAHRAGLIHLDVKPQNVLLDQKLCAKVTDFGLARFAEQCKSGPGFNNRNPEIECTEQQKTQTYRGLTPLYCSPEQAEKRSIDHRTDIWSWALVVLEMLMGLPSWIHGSMAHGWFQTMNPDKISKRYSSKTIYPLWDLLGMCLKEDPGERIDSFDKIINSLLLVYKSETGKKYPRKILKISPDLKLSSNEQIRKNIRSGVQWKTPEKWVDEINRSLTMVVDQSVKIPPIRGNNRRSRLLAELIGFQRLSSFLGSAKPSEKSESFMMIYQGVLMDASQVYYELEDYSGADEVVATALNISRLWLKKTGSIEWKKRTIRSVVNIVDSLRNQGNFKQATALLKDIQTDLGITPDPEKSKGYEMEVARFLEVQGILLMSSRHFDKALITYQRLLAFCEGLDSMLETDFRTMIPMVYQGLASVTNLMGNTRKALEIMTIAIKKIDSWNDDDNHSVRYSRGVVYSNMGQILNRIGDPRAIEYLNKAADAAIDPGTGEVTHVRLLIRSLLSKAASYSRQGNQKQNLSTLKELNDVLEYQIYINGRTELLLESVAVSVNTAAVYYRQKDHQQVMATAERCCRICDYIQRTNSRKDVSWMASAIRLTWATSLVDTGDLNQAMKLLSQVIEYRCDIAKYDPSMGVQIGIANALILKATIHKEKEEYEHALQAARKAIQQFDNLDPEIANLDQMKTLVRVADVYLGCLKNSDKLLQLKNEAQRLLEMFHDYNRENTPAVTDEDIRNIQKYMDN